MAHRHRAWKASAADFIKPWKAKRLWGKWLTCATCHPRTNKKRQYNRAENRRQEREYAESV